MIKEEEATLRTKQQAQALVLRHLSRQDKKNVLKAWHQSTRKEPPPPNQIVEEEEEACEAASPSSLIIQSTRSEHKATESEDAILRSVGEIQHAYKTRARQQEAAQKRIGQSHVRRQHLMIQSYRPAKEMLSKPVIPPPQQDQQDQQDEQDHEPQQDTRFRNLSAATVCLDAAFRDQILHAIRQTLVAGQDVILYNDCNETNDSLKDTKHMQQLLCTQSLAYCHREQEIVPMQDPQHQTVQLRLRSRLSTYTT